MPDQRDLGDSSGGIQKNVPYNEDIGEFGAPVLVVERAPMPCPLSRPKEQVKKN